MLVSQRTFRGKKRHLELLAKSLGPNEFNEWNIWRARDPDVQPDLRGANLVGANLQALRLDQARLDDARLDDSTLSHCQLAHADLRSASMRRVRILRSDMTGANLVRANLHAASLEGTLLEGAYLQRAKLSNARLIGCVLNRAFLQGADLHSSLFWGTSVWRVERDADTNMKGITVGLDPFDWPAIWMDEITRPLFSVKVDDIGVADFLSLVGGKPAEIAHILDGASRTLVLLLGRFRGSQARVLKALDGALRKLGYLPMVFDFEEPQNRDLIETVAILAGLSRFIIADLTHPRSTPLESHLIIPDMAVPFVPIIRGIGDPFSMFVALQRKYPWVADLVRYTTERDLLRRLQPDIVKPAEALARTLRKMKHPG
jgi:pentapeptide repeat protein